MYMTGMRVSECLSLTFEDFDGNTSIFADNIFAVSGRRQRPRIQFVRLQSMKKQNLLFMN